MGRPTLAKALFPILLAVGCASNAGAPVSSVHDGFSPETHELLATMSVDDKIGQLVQMAGGRSKSLNSRMTEDELARVRTGGVGSYLHVAGAGPLGRVQQISVTESDHGIPLLFAMDVVHGYRTIFPVSLAMAATFDPSDWEKAARISAIEATAAGLHWTFAPMVDIAPDPRWGRMVEGAGVDPYLGSLMAAAQVRGYQGDDLSAPDTMMATVKHFGAYGAAVGGRDYGSADISDRTLHEVYLPPFYAASAAGAASMMTAFNDIAGVPSTANSFLTNDVLRGRWGFDGMIVSDWNAVAELMAHGVAQTRAEAGELALRGGVDMDMTSGVFANDIRERILAAPDLQRQLDLAAGRVLEAKRKLGLFSDPLQYHDEAREAATMLSPEHRVAAQRVAQRAVVMLKNDAQTLPLKGEGRILIVGALADDRVTQLGSWRAQGRVEDVISIRDGLTAGAPQAMTVSFVPGAAPQSPDASGIAAAVAAASTADHVVLVIGEDYDLSGEARSRSSIELPASQRQLADAILALDVPVTTVIVSGRALAIPQIAEESEAILYSWMLGVEAGPALADIIFGRTSPAGRLPMDLPRTTGQTPIAYSEFPSGRPANPDLSVDSNRYYDLPVTPLYPFGHGLSYGSFAYENLRVSSARVDAAQQFAISVDVKNVSNTESDEVVQLYMRDPVASVARPKLQLRGVARVTIPAGESRTVQFGLTPAQTAIYHSPDRWQIEEGVVQFFVGGSSADLRLSTEVVIATSGISSVPAAAIPTLVEVQK